MKKYNANAHGLLEIKIVHRLLMGDFRSFYCNICSDKRICGSFKALSCDETQQHRASFWKSSPFIHSEQPTI